MVKKKIYISGPMSGHPDLNRKVFDSTAAGLRAMGYDAVNPAESDGEAVGGSWEDFLRKDIHLAIECDAVVVLPGWSESRGSRLEVYIAMSLGVPIVDMENLSEYGLEIAREPLFAVNGVAEEAYHGRA